MVPGAKQHRLFAKDRSLFAMPENRVCHLIRLIAFVDARDQLG
jgi:hypothetical protein